MKVFNYFGVICLAIIASIQPGHALIIDYGYVSTHDFDSLGQDVYNRIGQQTWYFTHASVGSNMVGGLDSLRTSNPLKYQLTTSGAGGTPPATITPGSVYEYGRGNPGWSQKYKIFNTTVENGWGNKVDFVMDKLCYIDEDADVLDYFTMMDYLESLNLNATLVYTTMPLTTSTGSDNVLRNNYNDAVRAYALLHNKLLFDIADLEAYNASGVEQTFDYDGGTYQRLFSGWSSDGGHLNDVGSEWIGKGWYSLAASQTSENDPVPEPATMVLMGLGLGVLLRRRLKSSQG